MRVVCVPVNKQVGLVDQCQSDIQVQQHNNWAVETCMWQQRYTTSENFCKILNKLQRVRLNLRTVSRLVCCLVLTYYNFLFLPSGNSISNRLKRWPRTVMIRVANRKCLFAIYFNTINCPAVWCWQNSSFIHVSQIFAKLFIFSYLVNRFLV